MKPEQARSPITNTTSTDQPRQPCLNSQTMSEALQSIGISWECSILIAAEQWGGFAEARVAAQLWNMSLFIVGHLGGNQYQLYMAPVLQAVPAYTCCLVYSGGNHFDALLASATDFHQRLGGPDQ